MNENSAIDRGQTVVDKSRLSLNQITTEHWTAREAIEGCARFGIPSIALWRHKIEETGLDACVKLVRDAGLHVSSVCRGGMFTAATKLERLERIEDNLRAIDQAASLQADSLVMVVGGTQGVPLDDARKMVFDGVASIVEHARASGVCIGLEPLHPMFAGDRSVLNTIDQALQIAMLYTPEDVGVVLDVIHIWWDPKLYAEIESARGRIVGFHVSDWLVPLPDILKCRGMMGDGVIEIKRIREAVDQTGYCGPIEVEILNDEIWNRPPDQVVSQVIERFVSLV